MSEDKKVYCVMRSCECSGVDLLSVLEGVTKGDGIVAETCIYTCSGVYVVAYGGKIFEDASDAFKYLKESARRERVVYNPGTLVSHEGKIKRLNCRVEELSEKVKEVARLILEAQK